MTSFQPLNAVVIKMLCRHSFNSFDVEVVNQAYIHNFSRISDTPVPDTAQSHSASRDGSISKHVKPFMLRWSMEAWFYCHVGTVREDPQSE